MKQFVTEKISWKVRRKEKSNREASFPSLYSLAICETIFWKKELARWTKRYGIKINTDNYILYKATQNVV